MDKTDFKPMDERHHAMTAHDDDAALLIAWAEGDREAATQLIERHYAAIERFFAYKAKDAADDLVQRTFLACAESAARFRRDSSVRAFLFGIARNILCEHIRARARDGTAGIDFSAQSIVDLVPGVVTLVGQKAEQRLLILALQTLPLDLQVLLELYYWEELSVEELGQALEIPAGTVKSRLHRARQLLKDALETHPPDSDEGRSARTLLERWLSAVRAEPPLKQ